MDISNIKPVDEEKLNNDIKDILERKVLGADNYNSVVKRLWEKQMLHVNSLQEKLRQEVIQSWVTGNKNDSCEAKVTIKREGYDLKSSEMEEVHYECPTGAIKTAFVSRLNIPRKKRGDKMVYKCKECGKEFMQRDNLIFHIRTHTGERPFKCDLCGKDFSREYGLKLHSRVHSGEKPYKCETCGREFSFRGTLRVHIRMHTKEVPYKCEVCGRGFKQIGCLQAHMRIHTGERPYKCGGCGKQFKQGQSLKQHVRRRKGENPCKYAIDGKDVSVFKTRDKQYTKTELGTYQCDVCGLDYVHQNSIINHVRKFHQTGKEFVCYICNIEFESEEVFKEHKLTHKTDLEFSCNMCDKKFKHQMSLKSHLRLHTGETPYKCEQCDKRFYCNNLLRRHVNTMHSERPFKCGLCDAAFRCNRELQLHLQSHKSG